jgi:predicted DsbA family dithiol-disulfide isomerase
VIAVDLFTDPGCPVAWSCEPQRRRLQWLFGDQLAMTPRMIVLSERVEDYAAKGFTTEKQQTGMTKLHDRSQMPFDLSLRPRVVATKPATALVVAAREQAGVEAAERVLRRLRIEHIVHARLIDEPEVLDAAARDAGLDRADLGDAADALAADMAAAREPLPAGLALGHKLAPAGDGLRYTAPTYVFRAGDRSAVVPGLQPIESLEVALANLEPALARREDPESVEEVLAWAPEPLAAAEVAMVLGVPVVVARRELAEARAVETDRGFFASRDSAAAARAA